MRKQTLTTHDRRWIAATLAGIALAVSGYANEGWFPQKMLDSFLLVMLLFSNLCALVLRFYCLHCTEHERSILWGISMPGVAIGGNQIFVAIMDGLFADAAFLLGLMLAMAGVGYILLNLMDER